MNVFIYLFLTITSLLLINGEERETQIENLSKNILNDTEEMIRSTMIPIGTTKSSIQNNEILSTSSRDQNENEFVPEKFDNNHKNTFVSHLAPIVIYFDNLNQTDMEQDVDNIGTSGISRLQGNESVTKSQKHEITIQRENQDFEIDIPNNILDPRKESCLYLHYDDCYQDATKFSTGEECFLYCYEKDGNKEQENQNLTSNERKRMSEKNTILTFKGNSLSKLKVHNDIKSEVFDVLFFISTLQTEATIWSIKQEPNLFNIKLMNGKLGVEINCQNFKETFFMEIGGIQEGRWHMCYVLVDESRGEILMQVNSRRETFTLNKKRGMECRFFNEHEDTEIWIGGITNSSFQTNDSQNGFVGCFTNASIYHSGKYLSITAKENIQELQLTNIDQTDSCKYSYFDKNYLNCSVNFGCLNDPKLEKICDKSPESAPIATLHGSDFFSYRLTYWNNRLHTFYNDIAFSFKSLQKDSILLYISGENVDSTKEIQFLSVTLTDKEQILFNLNLGGETLSITLGAHLCDNKWHAIRVNHKQDRVEFMVDEEVEEKKIFTESGNDFFYMDPVLFLGGVPSLNKDCALPPRNASLEEEKCQKNQKWIYDVRKGSCQNVTSSICIEAPTRNSFDDVTTCLDECHVNGLSTFNYFSGCLKNVLINAARVLDASHEKQLYYSGGDKDISISCDCRAEEHSSAIFPTISSYLTLQRSSAGEEFAFEAKMKFKSSEFARGYVDVRDEAYQWEIKMNESNVTFLILNLNDAVIVAPSNGGENWNDVAVLSTGSQLEFSVNGISTKLFLDNNVTFHRIFRIEGFIGCVKEIYVDKKYQDLRTYIGSSLASEDINMGNCQIMGVCETSSNCESTNISKSKLKASNNDEDSKTLQDKISDYRKSCYEYRLLGYNESGQFIIDIDGSGPTPAANVFCQFEANGNTFTRIDHNLPEKFSNVKINAKSFLIKVDYRDFTKKMLRDLISSSESCSQDVQFSCGPESLSFREASFSSAWQDDILYVGDNPFGDCHCTGNSDICYNQDKDDENVESFDKTTFAVNVKTNLPLMQLTFHRKSNKTDPNLEPNLSLGKLICKSKEDLTDIIQFHSPESSIVLPPWTKGDLRFRFRTTTNQGLLLYQPSVTVNTPYFKIIINSGYSITFSHGFKNNNKTVTFETNYPFSNGEWNNIWIDESNKSLRIVFNHQIQYMEYPFRNSLHLMDGYLILGNVPRKYKLNNEELSSGFKGCISNMLANDEEVRLSEVLNSTEAINVSLGCKSSCDGHPCKNGATCVEYWDNYKCKCANPFAHIGVNCEKDINENSITFMENNSEAVYNNSLQEDEVVNPLKSNFTFNIKTNQPDALLFVAKDYIQNILQIYLRNASTVVLLLNFEEELLEIKVTAQNQSLSKGQSVQIAIERLSNATTLYVSSRGETFSASVEKGISLMGEEDYKQYPYEVLNHLVQYQHSFTVPGKYFLIFIGGAKSYGMTSDLPGFIGCFRGLLINDVLMNFEDMESWTLGHGITHGCMTGCERNKPCKNNGICVDNFNSTVEKQNSCNCDGTSYLGKSCDEEIGYTFDGREDGIALLDWTAPYEQYFKISFAFSSESLDSENQQLVFVKMNNTRDLELEEFNLYLKEENIYLEWRRKNEEFLDQSKIKNLRSSGRHYIEAIFKDDKMQLNIDKSSISSSTSTNSTELVLGERNVGLSIGRAPEVDKTNSFNEFYFEGCISNLNIKSEFLNFWPLEQYKNGENFVRFGLPKLGQCSVFFEPKKKPIFYDFSKIPAWESSEPDIVPLNVYSDDYLDIYENELSTPGPNETDFHFDTTTGKIWPWALLGSVFFLMVLILLLCVLRGCCKSKNEADVEKSNSRGPELQGVREEIPLLENEPSYHGPIRPPRQHLSVSELPPYSLTPSENVQQNLKNKKVELTPHQAADEINAVNEEQVESSVPISIPLNTINRDSNNKIPFKNQLSADTNTLRHIDSSSSEDSLVVDAKPDEIADSQVHEQNGITLEEKLQNVQEANGAVDDSVDEAKVEDQNIDQIMDTKKFYLIRKASEPPKLPPKRK